MSDTLKLWSIYSLPNGSSGVIGEETTPLVKVVEYSAYDRIKCVLERLEINFKMVQEALEETKAELEHCSNAHQEVGVFWAEAEDKLKAEKAKNEKLIELLERANGVVITHAMQTYSKVSDRLATEINEVLEECKAEKS